MRTWLLRSGNQARYQLHGPMDRNGVIKAIQDGTVSLQDEVCVSGGYWFCFHESEELHKQLGISWNQVRKEALSEDSTLQSTDDTDSGEDTDEITMSATDPRIQQLKAQSARAPQRSPDPGSGLSVRLPGVPVWFWWAVGAVLFAVFLRFFGSTK